MFNNTDINELQLLKYFSIFGIFSLLYDIIFLVFYETYPPGYLYNNNNLFMDFLNTAYFGFFGKPYAEWQSVYLPAVFLFLEVMMKPLMEVIGWDGINALTQMDIEKNATQIRPILLNNNALIFPILALICALVCVLLAVPPGKLNIVQWRLYFLIILITSKPFLFCVERGNLLIIALPLISAFISTKSDFFRAIYLTLLISLKIYFVSFFLFWKSPRKFAFLFSFVVLLTVVLNLSANTYLNYEFNVLNYLEGLLNFNSQPKPLIEVMGFGSSFLPALGAFERLFSKLGLEYSEHYYLTVSILFTFYLCVTSLFVFSVLGLFWAQNEIDRLIIIILMVLVFLPSAGGYIGICLLPLLPSIIRNGDKIIIALLFFSLLTFDMGLYVSSGTLGFNLLLNEHNIQLFQWGIMIIVRPLVIAYILLRFSALQMSHKIR